MSHNPKPEALEVGQRVTVGLAYTGSVPLYGRATPSLATFERDEYTGRVGSLAALNVNRYSGVLEAHVLLDGADEVEIWLPARRCWPSE